MPAEAGFASRKPALHVHEKSSSCVTQVALACNQSLISTDQHKREQAMSVSSSSWGWAEQMCCANSQRQQLKGELTWQVTVPSPHEAVHVIPLFVVTYPDLQEHSYEPSKLVQSAFTGSQ